MQDSILQHREDALSKAQPALTYIAPARDDFLIQRIIDAYIAAAELGKNTAGQSQWSELFALNSHIHDALISRNHEYIAGVFANPGATNLFCGFDSLMARYIETRDEGVMKWEATLIFDNLIRLAEAIGAVRIENPEANDAPDTYAPDDVLDQIEASLEASVAPPNLYPNANGLKTRTGVLTYRDIQALYQAFRIKAILGVTKGHRVLELGAGLGRTAFYARSFGISDYTIIDLPLTNVSQAHFLGTAIGSEQITLFKEECRSDSIRIMPPSFFFDDNPDETFDLVVNVDSFTEMDPSLAFAYWEEIKHRTPLFLSINHERNPFTVRDVVGPRIAGRSHRVPYWMRRGYVEELFVVDNSALELAL